MEVFAISHGFPQIVNEPTYIARAANTGFLDLFVTEPPLHTVDILSPLGKAGYAMIVVSSLYTKKKRNTVVPYRGVQHDLPTELLRKSTMATPR